jgi:hypothetical protein
VIVQDGVHVSFESVLDLQAFSLRVPEQQLDTLPQRLLAVAPKELRRMQRNLRRVWHRWGWVRWGCGSRLSLRWGCCAVI